MERCPNCGQLGREGAKFCTICGQRLAMDETVSGVDPAASEQGLAAESPLPGAPTDDTVVASGWPASPSATPPPDSLWTAPAVERDPVESADADREIDEIPSDWAGSAPSAWPEPPGTADVDTKPEDSPPGSAASEASPGMSDGDVVSGSDALDQAEPVSFFEPLSTPSPPAASSDDAAIEDARARAMGLIEELHDAIAAIRGNEPPDLGDVIAELEVAVTPPGAFDPEALANLREALLSARERPRDLDTVVDLTGRIDAMVGLIIAYDRTVAAIERALDSLRQS